MFFGRSSEDLLLFQLLASLSTFWRDFSRTLSLETHLCWTKPVCVKIIQNEIRKNNGSSGDFLTLPCSLKSEEIKFKFFKLFCSEDLSTFNWKFQYRKFQTLNVWTGSFFQRWKSYSRRLEQKFEDTSQVLNQKFVRIEHEDTLRTSKFLKKNLNILKSQNFGVKSAWS